MPVRPWAIGVFIIAGFSLLTALLFSIGNRQEAFEKHVDFQTHFYDVSGLASGAKVRVWGLDAGKLKAIHVPGDARGKFTLDLEIEEKLHPLVHTDSLTSIETEGVVGDKFLLIGRGSNQSEVAPAGATLPSKEPVDLSAMMDQASGLLKDVHATVGDLRGRLDGALDSVTTTVNHANGLLTSVGPQVQKMTRDGGRITANIDSLVADINAGKGPAGLLLRDEATKQQLKDALLNAQRISANANEASERANKIISDFQARNLPAKTQATLDNVQAVSQQLNATMKDALAQDNMGENGAANIRETLSNINRSTANLADDTEALKHNFIFRGFFKKRGFFSLDQITPDEYRTALAQHKESGIRLWLQAGDLMSPNPDGNEDLSAAGRNQIDEAVAPELNTLSGYLIVVEGYSAAATPTRQFTIARRRAEQVRRYLETRYHLRHSDLGIVALGSTPPPTSGRSNWDGAAIMLLESKSKKK